MTQTLTPPQPVAAKPLILQPMKLGFDPSALHADDITHLLFSSFPTAAMLWMAVGSTHLRSQYFTPSCLYVGGVIDGRNGRGELKTVDDLAKCLTFDIDGVMRGVYQNQPEKRQQFLTELLRYLTAPELNFRYDVPSGDRRYLYDVWECTEGVHVDDFE